LTQVSLAELLGIPKGGRFAARTAHRHVRVYSAELTFARWAESS
jgi:hypothetical protein